MTLRPDLEPLLKATRSEAKRWAAKGPNLLLLALVVARQHESEFSAAFGERGQADVEARLAAGSTPGEEDAVVALLTAAGTGGGIESLIKELHQALSTQEPAASPVEAGVVEAEPEVAGVTGQAKLLVEVVAPDADIHGREDVVDAVLTVIGRQDPGMSLVIGPPGSGRTAIATALATRLNDPSYTGPLAGGTVVRGLAGLIAEKGAGRALGWVMESVEGLRDAILFLDDLDVVAGLTGPGVNQEVLALLRSWQRKTSVRIVATSSNGAAGRIAVHDADLAGRLVRTTLKPLSKAIVSEVATRKARLLGDAHEVIVSEEVALLSASEPRDAEHWAQPGLAVRRLDAACVRARLRGDNVVRESDLGMDGESPIGAIASDELGDRLKRRVIGQDSAVQVVARRLSLTRAGLDLRPERPDGAFLLVGPTGVGKTELARAVCAELYGDERRMIRLDMSEYAHDWAMSRIIGPMPGFVGSTEPETWLTTRVRQTPDTVILLDEIEKAHPTIWNAFLQVLDAGRLSDSRGEVTDFSRTIVIMTSNLGATAFSSKGVGFKSADGHTEVAEARVMEAVKAAMAPELVNRLDATVVFQPLASDTMLSIAAKEIGSLIDRLSMRGYRLTVQPEVLDHLAATGYDPHYGARHLQRNIEALLLQPLAEQESRELTASMNSDDVVWSAS